MVFCSSSVLIFLSLHRYVLALQARLQEAHVLALLRSVLPSNQAARAEQGYTGLATRARDHARKHLVR